MSTMTMEAPPPCDACGELIKDRILTSDGKNYHVTCFKCEVCGEQINGPYHMEGGTRTCGGCLEKKMAAARENAPVCGGCKQPISGEALSAGDLNFHPACFKCSACSTPITSQYFMNGEQIVCGNCRQTPVCGECKQEVSGKAVKSDDGQIYHPACFEKVVARAKEAKEAARKSPSATAGCKGCGKEFEQGDSLMKVGDFTFHKACFICDTCKNPIKGKYFDRGGKFACEDCHTKKVCATCHEVIIGETKYIGDKYFHLGCLICEKDGCKKSIASGFSKCDGQLLCKTCAAEWSRAGATTDSTPAANYSGSCCRCKKALGSSVITGDKGDKFHPECFSCFECGGSLEKGFVVDKERKFKYQAFNYLCPPCGDLAKQWTVGDKGKPCMKCKNTVEPGPDALKFLDGYCLHWSCFKCDDCGALLEADDPSANTVGRLLRNKALALKEGKYWCDDCQPNHQTEVQEAQYDIKKAKGVMILGGYVGKQKGVPGDDGIDTVCAINLLPGGKCWVMHETTKYGSAWRVDGTYQETHVSNAEDAAVKSVIVKVAKTAGAGPQVGSTLEFLAGKGASHGSLSYEGIACQLQMSTDVDLLMMIKPGRKEKKPEGHVEAAPTEEFFSGPLPLADLKIKSPVWKEMNVDPGHREMALSDEEFEALFKMDKEKFKAQPGWKQNNLKKQHDLF
eukprot:CAMPEP_0194487352 /NCGR_PEP_ID=MMETSP0253-20130528/7661_1 /TAXON_ID=2966 /ORGANISM="Noctiluca scintillans" /LENGTH=679 /DNA_ID=CAMNT_0039327557 /DNA_START=32 /DNA_END=2071 /DNA_ORIENTATION=+